MMPADEGCARFVTTLVQGERGKGAWFVVPAQLVELLGAGKRPPVKVTIRGYTYRTTIAVMGGEYLVGVAAEHRAKAEVGGGETVEVQVELDEEPRMVDVPPDLASALDKVGALESFEALAYTHRKEHVRSVNEAKTPETRRKRIEGVVKGALADKN